MKKFALIIGLFYALIDLKAQGNITISKPEGLDGLIYSRTAKRKNPDTKIDGFHIMIFRGDNRIKADNEKSKFDLAFAQYFSEVVWDEPVFKVYVGLFRTRLECMALMNQITDKYQTAIVIKDKILYPPLNY